jgi:glutamine cyclotransferase
MGIMNTSLRFVLNAICAWLITLCLSLPSVVQADPAAPVNGAEIVARYPHDPAAFTQGLVYHEGVIYEGTGLYGQSTLRRINLDGRNMEKRRLHEHLFGEGVTVFQDRIYQLTWKNGLGLVWNRENLSVIQSFAYHFEGWGITHDGSSLIMSDGSATLRFINPENFKELRRIVVADGKESVTGINELEYIRGEVWANIWKQDRIARIDPASGQVTGWVDLAGLVIEAAPGGEDNVLNGIAYDAAGDRIFVTGKRWRHLYEIRLLPLRP